jgi:hypothetical protein
MAEGNVPPAYHNRGIVPKTEGHSWIIRTKDGSTGKISLTIAKQFFTIKCVVIPAKNESYRREKRL